MRPLNTITYGLVLLLPQGCSVLRPEPKPAPVRPPVVDCVIERQAGSPLGDSLGGVTQEELDSGAGLVVEVDWFAVEEVPRDLLHSASSLSRWILSSHGERPLLPTGDKGLWTRVGAVADPQAFAARIRSHEWGNAVRLRRVQATLPRGGTLRLGVADVEPGVQRANSLSSRHFQLLFVRPEDEAPVRLSLMFRNLHEPARVAATAVMTAAVEEELLALNVSPGPREGATVVALPFPYSTGTFQGLMAVIQVSEPPRRDTPAFARHREQLQNWRNRPVVPSEVVKADPEALEHQRWEFLWSGLRDEGKRRLALASSVQTEQASLVEELSLLAEDQVLEEYVRAILVEAPEPPLDGVTWLLESHAILYLVRCQELGTLSAALRGLLQMRVGALAQDPGLLQQLVQTSTTLAEFHKRMQDEHQLLLQDPAAATRVQAVDWLHAQGDSLLNFDPLGSGEERAAALAELAARADDA